MAASIPMWTLTLRSPTHPPHEHILKPGKNSLGRRSDNTIVVTDESASRYHAEFLYDPQANVITLHDLNSTNGTFVNRDRIHQPRVLHPSDQIRVGEIIISLVYHDTGELDESGPSGTQPFNRNLLLEAIDQHAVLLYEVACKLNTITELDLALAEVSRLVKMGLGADKCEVILAEDFDRLPQMGFPTTMAQQAIAQRAVVIIPVMPGEVTTSPPQSASMLRVRSLLCVPTLIGEEIAALLYIYKTDPAARPFDQQDLRLAVAISHQAALTIQRTRLLNLSIRDPLTNLFNRRYLEETLRREQQRADRKGLMLGIIMLDIDHFKHFNDTYGHAAGDALLRHLGATLQQLIRRSDIACRYGGEEFTLVLLDASLEATRQRAEKLCQQVRQMTIIWQGQQLDPVSMSMGVAVYPLHGKTIDEVMLAADKALYQAKRSGRDRVCVAGEEPSE